MVIDENKDKKEEENKKEETPKKETKTEESKDKEEKVEVPKKFKKLVEEIESLSILELSELVKILEKKFGVSSAAPAVAAPVGAPAAGETKESEEKDSYKVTLTSVGEKKIDVIKAVREATQKGLKESKELVDGVANEPQIIKENSKKEEAEEIKKKFEDAGAAVELK